MLSGWAGHVRKELSLKEHTMDSNAVIRIRSSFQLLAPRGQELIDTFYQLLFTAAPSVRALFPSDMSKQKGHLLAAVGLVVKHADNLASLETPLMDMGERHVKYGARPEHYPVVRDTMIAALARVAGPAWDAQLAADWTAALNAVAGAMLKGAERAERRAAA
jgi:hemoglobin-like flavoprotein